MGSEFPIRLWLNRLSKYLVIPTVMCIVLLPLYSILHQQTVKAQMTDTAEQLASSVSTFEGYLYDVRFVTNKLFYTSEFNVLAASTDGNMLSDEANTNEAMGQLADLTYGMQAVSYSFVTFARNSLVIDNCRTHHSYNSFYPNVLEYRTMTREAWIQQLPSEKMVCLPVQQVYLYQTSYPESYLTISQPFFNSLGRYTGSCTMLVREKLLSQLFLPHTKWQESCLFYIMTQDGQILMRHRFEDDTPPVDFGETGIHTYRDQEYMFVSRPIHGLDAVAVLGLPRSVYAEDLEAVDRGIRFYIVAAVVVCLVLSLFMTLMDIWQLRPLIENLGSLKDKDSRMLHKLILQKIQAHNQLSLELERTRNQIEQARMEALLKTGSANSPTEHKLLCETLGLAAFNCLLLIPAPPETEEGTSEELRMLLIEEQLHQCWGMSPYVHHAADGSMLTVLPMEDGSEKAYADLRRKAEELYEALSLSQPLILSAPFSRLEQLSSVYWQARNAVAYADREQAVFCLKAQTWVQTLVPEIATLERLSEYLMAGCTEQAQSLIQDSFAVKNMTLENFLQIFYSIRGVLLTAADKVSCEDIQFLCAYDPRISKTKQIQNLCECCLAIGSHVDALKQSHNTQLQQGILQFLEENYGNPDLNAAMVADKFQISKKYVSQFLKDQTGKSFSEYVEELRLGRAMELLRESDHSVTDIAAMCGFFSQNTFYKAFRRRYEVSPSAVRREAKNG